MSYRQQGASSTPLLSSVASPGQRLSYHSGEMESPSQSSSSARTRYGPTASPYSGSTPSVQTANSAGDLARRRGAGPGAAVGAGAGVGAGADAAGGGRYDGWDDDDLDDELHTFTAKDRQSLNSSFDVMSWRGWANAGALLILLALLVGVFALYPIISYYTDVLSSHGGHTAGFNLGGVNSTGQYPDIPGLPRLIDPETPSDAYTKRGFDGSDWTLVFSDEFNTDGRTFYEGDDPFWTAQDLHYWPTGDLEWHDPGVPITKDGHLLITMTQEPINDLNLKSGMINTWNKLCFNKNMIFEVSASLPGQTDITGFWPGVWTMGNLGRAAYGATTEGTWPYSYDSCDVGTLANQTYVNGTGPLATLTTSPSNGPLSFLPGQRHSACTCPGEDHPGPDVTVGRAAPEIDLIEAQLDMSVKRGRVSQSFQIAPFDAFYEFDNSTNVARIYDRSITQFNGYKGGPYQQSVSGVTLTPDRIYTEQFNIGPRSGEFGQFSFEYQAFPEEREKGYIHWVVDDQPAWTLYADAIGSNSQTEIARRLIAEEPMYLLINLHASVNWEPVQLNRLKFPAYMRIDWVRVYQHADRVSVGCDPADMPTSDYINRHQDIYTNPNLTLWNGLKPWPKNSLLGCD